LTNPLSPLSDLRSPQRRPQGRHPKRKFPQCHRLPGRHPAHSKKEIPVSRAPRWSPLGTNNVAQHVAFFAHSGALVGVLTAVAIWRHWSLSGKRRAGGARIFHLFPQRKCLRSAASRRTSNCSTPPPSTSTSHRRKWSSMPGATVTRLQVSGTPGAGVSADSPALCRTTISMPSTRSLLVSPCCARPPAP
jgi:hypothetical protein